MASGEDCGPDAAGRHGSAPAPRCSAAASWARPPTWCSATRGGSWECCGGSPAVPTWPPRWPSATRRSGPRSPPPGGWRGDGVRLADALVPVMTAVVAVWQGWRSRRGRPRGELGAPGRRGDRTGPINASLKARPGTRPPARATEPSTRNQAWRRRRGESSCNACNSLQRLARALTWAFNAVATACNALSWR